MKVMLAVASRHGATWEIGSHIVDVLSARDHSADLVTPESVTGLDGYDAAVVGSAVYLTQLLPSARQMLNRCRPEFAAMPLWLFASGLARPMSGARTAADLAQLADRLGARGFQLFRGRLERDTLSFAERVAAARVLNREGDHRDFDAVERWAAQIADSLDKTGPDAHLRAS
ncbi:MAG: flavodoxin domain-containing protein [Micrococcales bacterium]|nr:flavodoxin domain-containing protein [Micrococcales bacterium]MCL2666989.1 flavodoxin domain-containing protein [Micrococcales bacterium]